MVSYSSAFATSFPSSSSAELGAIFTAILVAPKYCHITIYTDSQVVIQQFAKFNSIRCFSPSIRPLQKITNYPLWFSLFDVIDKQHLTIVMRKVKAHSGDLYNEKVDQLAKQCYDSSALLFNLTYIKQHHISYKGMCVTVPIRPLIQDITQSIMYSNFQHLSVINKYHHLNIHWLATAFYLNDNIATACTSYEASAVKKKKIQRLIEFLPTMEVLKLRHPNVFDQTWFCVRCESDDESFNHIWECPTSWTLMRSIIQDSQLFLWDLIKDDNIFAEIQSLPIWHITINYTPNLIALIKGLIPHSLCRLVLFAMKTKDLTLATLSAFMHFIFEHTQKIWTDRCARQINFEKTNNIGSNTKKDNTSATGYEKTQQTQVLMIHDAIDKMVRLGSHWTNFWCRSGQALSHRCDYWKMIVLA